MSQKYRGRGHDGGGKGTGIMERGVDTEVGLN
jgi:hypothetical protein